MATRIIKFVILRGLFKNSLNSRYNKFNYKTQELFHSVFAKIFKQNEVGNGNRVWRVEFMNKQLDIPLKKNSLSLDWDIALSVLGHESDIKITYETLLRSSTPPRCFFDIGANYGTHTLLFRSAGVESVAFEPNPSCISYFEKLSEFNDLSTAVEKVALGETTATAELLFPVSSTSLGTLRNSVKENFNKSEELKAIQVDVITIDSYVLEKNKIPELIKIDTEGYELKVLRGASTTIRDHKPLVIFESDNEEERNGLWKIFSEFDYQICPIPIVPDKPVNVLMEEDFLQKKDGNFIAIPLEHSLLQKN
ncbi:MAG: FkbM family methyltransferase [Bacteroidetes bacterium]|nr:FkbM family methyltransferase [Bacteroidota bacterium]